jgi:uncharacterized protein YeeX (DUF496 family)
MIAFVDGLQNVGKSTILGLLPEEYVVKTFSFAEHCINFDIKNNKDKLNGFQIGKDLGFMFALEEFCSKGKIIFDRGPVSTLYYSLFEDRMTENELNCFFDVLQSYNKDYLHIFVEKINDNINIVRNKNDGFDYIEKNENIDKSKRIIETIKDEFKKRDIQFIFFQNDYSKTKEENAENFVKLLKTVGV